MEKVRRDWFDSIDSFYTLKGLCYKVGCDICDSALDAEDINKQVMSEVYRRIDRGDDWHELRCFLSNDIYAYSTWDSETEHFTVVPPEFDAFAEDHNYEGIAYRPLNRYDFATYKDNVKAWLDENDLFEPDDKADEDNEFETNTSLEEMLSI